MKLNKHVLSAAIGSVLTAGALPAIAASGIGADGNITSSDGWSTEGGFGAACPVAAICAYGDDRTVPTEILIGGHYDFPMDPSQTTPNGNAGFSGTPIAGGQSGIGGNNYIRFVPNVNLTADDLITFELSNGCWASAEAFLVAPENEFQQPNIPAPVNLDADNDDDDVVLAATPLAAIGDCPTSLTLRVGDNLEIDRGTQLLLADIDVSKEDIDDGAMTSAELQLINPVIRVDQGLPGCNQIGVAQEDCTVTIRVSAVRPGAQGDIPIASAGPATLIDVLDQFSADIQADTATIDVFALIINDNTDLGDSKGIEDEDDNSIPRRRFDDEFDLSCSDDPNVVGGDDVLECNYVSDNTDLERSAALLSFSNNPNLSVDDYIILDDSPEDHEFEITFKSSTNLAAVDIFDSFVQLGDDSNPSDTSFFLQSVGDNMTLTTGDCPSVIPFNTGVDADNLPGVNDSFADDAVIGVNATNEVFEDEIIEAREWTSTFFLCLDDPTNGTDTPDDAFGSNFTLYEDETSHIWANNSIVLESTYVNLNPDFNNRFIFMNTANAPAVLFSPECRNESGPLALDLGPNLSFPTEIPADSTLVFFADELLLGGSGPAPVGNAGPQNRAACTFFIAGGNGEVQGTSQVIQAGVGAITDSPMLRPGTN